MQHPLSWDPKKRIHMCKIYVGSARKQWQEMGEVRQENQTPNKGALL